MTWKYRLNLDFFVGRTITASKAVRCLQESVLVKAKKVMSRYQYCQGLLVG